MKKVALVTNATKYAGTASIEALMEDYIVIAHDEEFEDETLKRKYEKSYPNIVISNTKSLKRLINTIVKENGQIDVLVSNDVYPLVYNRIADVEIDEVKDAFESLVIKPFELMSQVVRKMEKNKKGQIILVTSDAPDNPKEGFSVYSSARAAATILAKVAAKELASSNIMVYVIAPNYFESETYYPRELWDTEENKEKLKKLLPIGRLGSKDEMKNLIKYISSGKADFLTGNVFKFTGGWD